MLSQRSTSSALSGNLFLKFFLAKAIASSSKSSNVAAGTIAALQSSLVACALIRRFFQYLKELALRHHVRSNDRQKQWEFFWSRRNLKQNYTSFW